MSHYFSQADKLLKSKEFIIKTTISNTDFQFYSDYGVFSKRHVDMGTKLLIDTVIDNPKEKVLDLGSGIGIIGIVLAKKWKINPIMVEINQRALELSKKNIKLNNVEAMVINSDGFQHIKNRFDLILTNPPISAGKKVFYRWFEEAKKFLNDEGALFFVIRKDKGAASAFAFCQRHYQKVDVIKRKSGFLIVKCQKGLTT